MGQPLEQRHVGQRRQQAARHDDLLAADAIREPAEEDEEAGADEQRDRDHDVGGLVVDLERDGQEEQRVELAGVPDHALTGRRAEQREEHDLEVAPLAEGFGAAAPSWSSPPL